ncbi:MAG: ROK family protein [Thermomicrobiales bacterium]
MARKIRSANRDLMRRMNETLVLGITYDFGPISRSDIAETSGLSLATISSITGALIEEGIVIEQSPGESTGGRRPILLAIDRAAGLIVGAKLTQEHIVVAMTDLGGDVVEQRAMPLGSDLQPESVISALGALVDGLRSAYADRRFLGLGIGMAGIIDRAEGICRYSPFLHWRDVPIRQMLESRIGMPVIVENDVNALTLAERWFGAGAGLLNFLVVTLGAGVGMGMLLNGELYRGGHDGAGEFGHSTVIENGPLCNCGKRGCVEAFVSEPALQRAAVETFGRDIGLEEAIALARAGDDRAMELFRSSGHVLGLALSSVINVLNPTLVIVGGEGTLFLDLLLPSLKEALAAHCFADLFNDIDLVVEPWGDDAWARGAAVLMLDDFFHPPDHGNQPEEDGSPRRRGGRAQRPSSFSLPPPRG